MAVAAVGEDAFVWCEHCDYAANTEAATKQEVPAKPAPDDAPAMEKVHTPDLPGIERGRQGLKTKPNRLLKCDRVRRRRRPRARGRARQPRGERVRARRALPRTRRCGSCTDADFAARPRPAEGLHRPGLRGREARRRRLVGARAASAGSPARTRSTTTSRGAVLGRDFTPTQWAEIAIVEPGDACPKCGAAAAHRPRHRGRSRLPARHEVHRGARRALHRRGRRAAPDGDGLLRHRREPDHRGGRRGAPRRERHRVAGRARAVRRARDRDARRRVRWPKPRSSSAELARPGSTCSSTTARCGPA